MLDIQTVGAGGGSIARVDEGGLLRVGPESAGAIPDPRAMGKVNCRLSPMRTSCWAAFGLTSYWVDRCRSTRIVPRRRSIGSRRRLKLTRRAAAEGIIRIANANMERAIRSVSVERGYDPREFALVAFGGCGGLHACEMADDSGDHNRRRAGARGCSFCDGYAYGGPRARLHGRRDRP